MLIMHNLLLAYQDFSLCNKEISQLGTLAWQPGGTAWRDSSVLVMTQMPWEPRSLREVIHKQVWTCVSVRLVQPGSRYRVKWGKYKKCLQVLWLHNAKMVHSSWKGNKHKWKQLDSSEVGVKAIPFNLEFYKDHYDVCVKEKTFLQEFSGMLCFLPAA